MGAADPSRRDFSIPRRRRPSMYGISGRRPPRPDPAAPRARGPGPRRAPRRPSSGPITHDMRPHGEAARGQDGPGVPTPRYRPRRDAPRRRAAHAGIARDRGRAGDGAGAREGRRHGRGRAGRGGDHPRRPDRGQLHGHDRDDPRQDLQPQGPPPQPRHGRRRRQGPARHQALRQRPVRRVPAPRRQGGDPHLQDRRDAGVDEGRVHRREQAALRGHPDQDAPGDDRTQGRRPDQPRPRAAGGRADQAALRGEGLRADRGQADQGGRPRRPRGHHQHLRGAAVPDGRDQVRRQ